MPYKDKEKQRLCHKNYRNRNKEKIKESIKKWKENNKEKVREQSKKDSKAWRERNYNRWRESERLRLKIKRPSYQHKLLTLKVKKGGRCAKCGYDEEVRILHFHHLRDKKFNLSNYNRSLNEMIEEAEKCILLCPNCHALLHLKEKI